MKTISGAGIIYIFSAAKHNEFTSTLLKPGRKEILKSFYQVRRKSTGITYVTLIIADYDVCQMLLTFS